MRIQSRRNLTRAVLYTMAAAIGMLHGPHLAMAEDQRVGREILEILANRSGFIHIYQMRAQLEF